MDNWNYNKTVRELTQQIHEYEIHAEREIRNNQVCNPTKVRNNSQRYLELCKQRFKKFTGEDYQTNINNK